MKLTVLSLVALLATNSISHASEGRSFFGDGSVENTYVAGQHISAPTQMNSHDHQDHIGRTMFGDGSVENSYVFGQRAKGVRIATDFTIDLGRNGFGDGSPLSN